MSQSILCWTDIPVTDLDRAIAFYSAVLAAPVLRQTFPGGAFGLLPHAGEAPSGCLMQAEDNVPSRSGPLIYLSVNGRLDDAIAAARAHGSEVLQDRHMIGEHGFRAVITDSEGNRIALHSQTA